MATLDMNAFRPKTLFWIGLLLMLIACFVNASDWGWAVSGVLLIALCVGLLIPMPASRKTFDPKQ